ncbi:hypothetical protein M3Y94_00146100 [Aphelenchoides besseyi]|nr:hypothetical protein M3Y94_00146100 [Aphelenchoides besseyi]KAI6237197.1 hypothetical protein M3Y95_00239900 [Aphelenchoides besseyi]
METCLGAGQLALVIFGAIFGTLAICAAFFILIWRWLRKHNDSKVFYLQRSDCLNSNDVAGKSSRDETDDVKSSMKKNAQELDVENGNPTIQQTLLLSGNSTSTSSRNTANERSKLPELGVTIRKVERSGFEIDSIEKVDSSFVSGDRLTELSIRLDQLSLSDASTLLELLVPYQIQLEVLRAQISADSQPTQPDEVDATIEVHDETEKPTVEVVEEIQPSTQIEEQTAPAVAPRLPSVSPPRSPVPSERVNSPVEQDDSSTPPPIPSAKPPTDEEVTTRRLATRIPTPKSGRTRLSAERMALDSNVENRSDSLPPKPPNGDYVRSFNNSINSFQYEKRESLPVSSEETDEFGLTAQQYTTLESNRRRLERERQQLRDLGILS